jgi:hypothetical protein
VALTRAFYWQQLIDDGVVGSGSEIAQREGLHHSTVNELLRLTLLEPAVIQIDAGRAAASVHEPAVVSAEPVTDGLGGTAGCDCGFQCLICDLGGW